MTVFHKVTNVVLARKISIFCTFFVAFMAVKCLLNSKGKGVVVCQRVQMLLFSTVRIKTTVVNVQ